MSTSDTAVILKKILDKWYIRNALKLFLKKNNKFNKTYLELGLRSFIGEDIKTKDPRIVISKFVVKKALDAVVNTFEGDRNQVMEILKKPYDIRGVIALIKGYLKFGLNRPFTPGAPFLVVWDYTYKCNLRCKHCYINAGGNRPEMSPSEKKRALDIMADAGLVSIAFSGGEPLLDPTIFDMIKRAHDYGIFTAIASNGTLITEEIALKLKNAGLNYAQISLDSPDPAIHDEFRGVLGTWERTVRGIRNLKRAGITVEISTTVTKYNVDQVVEMIKLSEKLGADIFMHYNFIPTGRGKNIINMDINPLERENLLRSLAFKLYNEFPLYTLSTAPQLARVSLQIGDEINSGEKYIGGHFYSFASNKAADVAEFLGGCGAGRLYISLEPNGDIQPCVFLPIKIGNILKDDFEDLWINNEILNSLRSREDLKGFCGACQYRYVCGGCRARAYAYYGDIKAPDPGCIYNKDEWEKLKGRITAIPPRV